SVKAMHEQVGDLCFTGDGIAKRGVLVRHLVMPGLEEEGEEIVRWLAGNVSKDLFLHVMEQYHPRAHVGKSRREMGKKRVGGVEPEAFEPGSSKEVKRNVRYEDINRPVSMDEVSMVKKAAKAAGLWRFVEAAEHGGFNI
ncbi:hypothetical protein LTS18_001352, partial [Coniosporium uncinatum]